MGGGRGMEVVAEGEGKEISKKEKRALKKQKKLIAEFELSKSNDAVKRPGKLLDAAEPKKLKVIEPTEGTKLSPEEFKKLKKLLNERKKVLQQLPRFYLQGAGSSASLGVSHDVREPVFMSDVQHLLMYALGGNSMIPPPTRWCGLQKAQRLTHILTLIVEGVTSREFVSYEHLFPNLTSQFSDRVEVVAPAYYGRDVAEELSCIPLSNAQKEAILQQYGSVERAVTQKEIVKQFRALFPTHAVEAENPDISVPCVNLRTKDLPAGDVFPRTYLLMALNQMTFEGYPMPFWMQLSSKCAGYKMSKDQYKEVSLNSPMYAIDCEMCMTQSNPSELTRIAVVDENLKVVYESLVKPKEKITNYLTKYSGITEEMLQDVTTTLEDVQEALIRLLPEDAIWIGQSLNCDLHAMKMMHPYVIDTSLIFNLSGVTGRKSKLSHMAEVFLGEDIQSGQHGHCPTEDARTCMKLVKLKLSKGFLFGDSVNTSDDPHVPESVLTTSIFNRAYKSNKTVAVIGHERVLQEYDNVTMTPPEGTAFSKLKVESNKEAIEKIAEVGTSHQLTIAHIDVSKKLLRAEPEKKEKVLKKLDSWCETVFNHVSANGMCVVVFSGPKLDQIPTPDDNKAAESHKNEDSSSASDVVLPNPDQQTKKKKKAKPRRNGVCFVRIRQAKV